MNEIFEKTIVNGMELNNRLMRSATWEGMCEEDGRPTDKLTQVYRELAKGGVGLIITGYTFVRPEGKQLPGKMGLCSDAFEAEMRAITEAVHAEGGRICIQLVHAGGQADPRAAKRVVAPSAVKVDQYPVEPEELSASEIGEIVKAFADAARRAKSYGFDAVQFHGAHGYLINQFLSPLANRRTDEYGGSPEKRRRFLIEVFLAVRDAVGRDFPVLIKLNGSDFLEGGLEPEEAVEAAKALCDAGIDLIEVSGGTPASGRRSPARGKILAREDEAYHLSLAKKIKAAVSCSVAVVGGLRSLDLLEELVSSGAVDYLAMARPLIREPGLPKRWASGNRDRARCMSCNGCFRPGLKGEGVYCVNEEKAKEDAPASA